MSSLPLAIETPRLVLRQWRAADRAPFAELNADPRIKPFDHFQKSVREVAAVLDGMGGTPAGDTFKHMATSLRLYACATRSVNNCLSLGTVRDRNLAKLTGPAHIPPKIGDWVGDVDLQ